MAEPALAAEPKPRRRDPAHGLTLAELEEHVGTRVGAQSLRTTLAELIAGGGLVEHDSATGCYFLAEGIDPELREARATLGSPDDDDSRAAERARLGGTLYRAGATAASWAPAAPGVPAGGGIRR